MGICSCPFLASISIHPPSFCPFRDSLTFCKPVRLRNYQVMRSSRLSDNIPPFFPFFSHHFPLFRPFLFLRQLSVQARFPSAIFNPYVPLQRASDISLSLPYVATPFQALFSSLSLAVSCSSRHLQRLLRYELGAYCTFIHPAYHFIVPVSPFLSLYNGRLSLLPTLMARVPVFLSIGVGDLTTRRHTTHAPFNYPTPAHHANSICPADLCSYSVIHT